MFFYGSCAKTSYLYHQSVGQLKLLNSARPNQEVLNDKAVTNEAKDRIRKIQELKDFFYNFFSRPTSKIYSKVAFLQQEAVTYLVIASPFDQVKAHEEWFPFMGDFPYLGFFSEEHAKEWAGQLEEKGLITYVRPVYAYSTLGYFEDPILSSFFHWNHWELVNVIFHELFHTIFFIKDEVDLNESLADYFGEELAKLYFKFDGEKLIEIEKKIAMSQKIAAMIRQKVDVLNARYADAKGDNSGLDRARAQQIYLEFEKEFKLEGRQMCAEGKIADEDCLPLERKWNNAAFAAFLTYDQESDRIRGLHKSLKLDLPHFLQHLEMKYQKYKEDGPNETFVAYLMGSKE
ncbi:MAG: aminopeptidase [Bdellovibrio sp.]|nr:aminopeptidase [Bdellovibrio sp.]